MSKYSIVKFKYGRNNIVLETGRIARQATSSIIASMDDTVVIISLVVSKQEKSECDFFPLTVNYQERTYAAGRFPGGFFRRENRPNENEILISRLIDRPIRPLFYRNFSNEVQITATVVSVNPQINPDIITIIGTSAALSISGIPFLGPIGAARVGLIDNKYILNPTQDELINSTTDIVISSTNKAIIMLDLSANIENENKILDGIIFGHNQQQIVIEKIQDLVDKSRINKWILNKKDENKDIKNKIKNEFKDKIFQVYSKMDKLKRNETINEIKSNIINEFLITEKNTNKNEIINILQDIEKETLRSLIIDKNIRLDGRKYDEIRIPEIVLGILPRTHGSVLFTRGDTQALVTVTLGTERDAQNIDELIGERVDRFLLHYNFPPYCTGEIGIIGFPKRREIGHGKLAKKGIITVIPNEKEFPYTIRVVSEITESNGSSSMASVCGASLALMDAGVPIKSAIAGISMGLIKKNSNFAILSDILGEEDHIGDMDFKITGNRNGISAVQMDIKSINSVDFNILDMLLKQSKKSREDILDFMDNAIKYPRLELSKFAPKIHTIKINPNKIRDVIGKGGIVIKSLTEKTNTKIDIENDGTIKIASLDNKKAYQAICKIQEIVSEIEINKIYKGTVTRIMHFGIFVNIKNGKEGLVHISKFSGEKINKINNFFKIGQKVFVKVIDIDKNNKIKLSIKDI